MTDFLPLAAFELPRGDDFDDEPLLFFDAVDAALPLFEALLALTLELLLLDEDPLREADADFEDDLDEDLAGDFDALADADFE